MKPLLNSNQILGVAGEDETSILFSRMGWNTSKDRLDLGYDLGVEPSHDISSGLRFLVQVKSSGTDTHNDSYVKARIERKNLNLYKKNKTPVFIVRVVMETPTSAPKFYWLHIQKWIKKKR